MITRVSCKEPAANAILLKRKSRITKKNKILDSGCGTGRHAIELTQRGYMVAGIDLSEALLQRARAKAAAQNLQIDFRRHDARILPFLHEFDLAIMLCEGAFPLSDK